MLESTVQFPTDPDKVMLVGDWHFRHESRRPRPEGGHTHIVGLAHDRARYTDNYVMLDLGKEN